MEKRLTVHLKGIKRKTDGKSKLFNTLVFSVDSSENIKKYVRKLSKKLAKEATPGIKPYITKWNLSNFKIPGHSKGNFSTSQGKANKVKILSLTR